MTEGYEVVESRTSYEGPLSRVRIDRVRMPDGNIAEREVVEHPDAVAVVPVDPEGRVVLVRQYRHPVQARELELPAGKLDVADESPEEAAARELAEEVGLAAGGELIEMVRFHNSAGWTDETTTVYLAVDVTDISAPEGFTPAAEEADLEVVRVSLADAVARGVTGEITDAKTLIGLLLAERWVDGGWTPPPLV